MKNLIDIESLSVNDINQICTRAWEFEKGSRKANHQSASVVNMFFENSTRTKMSFQMAQSKINVKSYDFNSDVSSINKGEELYDTINNLSAIGMDVVVMRHSEDYLIDDLASRNYYQDISFINAGSGKHAHPTQALLDYYTMRKNTTDLEDRIVVIVGDVAHSRVARSNIALLKKFGVKLRVLAPPYFKGEAIEGVEYHTNLKEAFDGAGIVMALRIQKERIQREGLEYTDFADYVKNYQITKENLPPNALLMHPGPVNRNVEIKNDVIDSVYGKTILDQAKNGVFIRMAVMDLVLGNRGQ